MRFSQPRANGQWLQVKITSVPAFPVTSAIDIILPSTAFFIFTVAAGAFAPTASGPVICRATAKVRAANVMESSWKRFLGCRSGRRSLR